MNHDVLSAGLNISGFSLRFPESKPWDVQNNQKRTVSFIVVYAYYCNNVYVRVKCWYEYTYIFRQYTSIVYICSCDWSDLLGIVNLT